MKLNYCIIFWFCIYGVVSDETLEESEGDVQRKKILDQLTRTRTVLLDGYHLVTRQTTTDVYMFKSYRSVSVIFYPVMRDVSEARFTFQAEELHLNNIGTCDPQHVIINLKHGSYPAVNPDGYSFPKHFIDPSKREHIHTLDVMSTGNNQSYTIMNPEPGNWYAVAYIKWEDPRTQRVEQQGLTPNCQTILYTDLQVKREENITLIDCTSVFTVDYTELPNNFKCMSADSNDLINFQISIKNTPEEINTYVKIQARSMPTEEKYLVYCHFDPNLDEVQRIVFDPHPNTWHYIEVGTLGSNLSSVANCESSYLRNDEVVKDTMDELMRDDKGQFFTFEFGLPTSDIQDSTSLVNLTSDEFKILRFKVNQFHDIGGNLQIEASVLQSLKYYMGFKRDVTNGNYVFTKDNPFKRIVICLDIGHTSTPSADGQCRFNDKVKPALFVLNTTDSDTVYDKVIIPYPESGVWYLSSRVFCDNVVCPCPVSDSGKEYYINSKTSSKKIVDANIYSNNTRIGEAECNATVILSITSTACIASRCMNHGSCLLNTFGGMVMSFCSCASGYGAWDCSDDSRMEGLSYMLSSILLLTLSNLLFFLSIYVAIIRLYFTEAMMFTFTMVFSTFYHACDAPAQVAYCIMKRNILQFGDFFCGLMSFWVTLLAMSIVSHDFKSFLQLLGAIMIALLTTWNMHALFAFILPVCLGVSIVFISWYFNYRKHLKLKFPRTYYTRFLPLGIVLVSIGLICFAFLQTEQNYKIVHSIWHMIIALSVVCLLPDVRRENGAHPFLLHPDHMLKLKIYKLFRRNGTPINSSDNNN